MLVGLVTKRPLWYNGYMELARYTSVQDGNKTCTSCGETKPVEDFYFYKKNGVKYPYPRCKPCENARSTKWQQDNPEKAKANRARWYAKHPHYFRLRNYGLTLEDYDLMVAAQDGKCAICGTVSIEGEDQAGFTLAVDHNHRTGVIRGLLCIHCNTGLAMFRDSPEFLTQAVGYLNRTDGT